MRTIIGSIKLFFFFLASLIALPFLAIGYVLFNKSRLISVMPNLYGKTLCFILRIKVERQGQPETKRHVIFVGNHLSYADIGAIGGYLPASFISKAEVKKWPLFGALATLGKTVFIERDRHAAEKGIADIKKALRQGQNLILFPEGTSTNGLQVLPFKSTLFEIFLSEELKDELWVQPFTMTITGINGAPVTRPEQNDIYAWYGDDEFLPHLWRLAKSRGAYIKLTFHPPKAAKNYNDRKVFANDCHEDVARGLQNTLPATLDFQTKAA
jgi:1-acyl-sn-glycerol-3-phosphate acyltransferase